MTTPRRRLTLATALLATTTLLAACAPEPAPELVVEPAPEFAPPALTEERAAEILGQVEEQVSNADAVGDVEQMRQRVTSPAVDFRQTQYALQAATGGAEVPQPLWTESDLFVVTATDSWPRSVLAVSNTTSDSTIRYYLALVQDSPRADYQLVAWSRLLPGVPTPTFATAEVGSAPIAFDQAELALTPGDALTHLADVMTTAESAYAGEFAPDPFRTFLTGELDGLRQGVQVAGEVSTASTAGPPVFAIATADGGALVMGTVESTVSLRKTIEGATLTLSGQMASLGGAEEVTAAAVATYQQMVTLYIPPVGAENTQVQLLGAERVLASVERVE